MGNHIYKPQIGLLTRIMNTRLEEEEEPQKTLLIRRVNY